MPEMSPEQVEELAAKATAGPWTVDIYEGDHRCPRLHNVVINNGRPEPSNRFRLGATEDDSNFVAAARTHWPLHAAELIEARRRIEQLTEAARKAIDEMKDSTDHCCCMLGARDSFWPCFACARAFIATDALKKALSPTPEHQ